MDNCPLSTFFRISVIEMRSESVFSSYLKQVIRLTLREKFAAEMEGTDSVWVLFDYSPLLLMFDGKILW